MILCIQLFEKELGAIHFNEVLAKRWWKLSSQSISSLLASALRRIRRQTYWTRNRIVRTAFYTEGSLRSRSVLDICFREIRFWRPEVVDTSVWVEYWENLKAKKLRLCVNPMLHFPVSLQSKHQKDKEKHNLRSHSRCKNCDLTEARATGDGYDVFVKSEVKSLSETSSLSVKLLPLPLQGNIWSSDQFKDKQFPLPNLTGIHFFTWSDRCRELYRKI